jgi:protein-S-isoprenylcysteine O-methyltransferase Ste14
MEAAHPGRWQIFEVIFGVPFLIALALQMAVPLSLPRGPLTAVFVLCGVGLILTGATLAILARRAFARQQQPTEPGLPTTELVTTGVFSISRNPLYVGGACALLGIALAANLPWVLVLLVPALVACHYILIVPEERYLAAKFREEYRLYSGSVHRWLGRTRR